MNDLEASSGGLKTALGSIGGQRDMLKRRELPLLVAKVVFMLAVEVALRQRLGFCPSLKFVRMGEIPFESSDEVALCVEK